MDLFSMISELPNMWKGLGPDLKERQSADDMLHDLHITVRILALQSTAMLYSI